MKVQLRGRGVCVSGADHLSSEFTEVSVSITDREAAVTAVLNIDKEAATWYQEGHFHPWHCV